MPQDVKIFKLGGMDRDSAYEFIQSEDWISAWNARVTGSADGESGIVTNPESFELITGTRSTGINKGIGGAGFEVIRTAYFFIYNSQQLHIIGKLDYDTGTQTTLFTNKTNSGGTNILDLNPSYYVTDVRLINDVYLAWTDGNMQPCLINIDRLESGDYGTVTLEDLLIIKGQYLVPPIAVYGDDAGQSVNLLQGKLFQFRAQWQYKGFFRSAGSTWSKRPVPVSEATPAVGTDVTVNNNITVSVDIGSDEVDQVNVWAHYGNLDWFTIKSATRAYILALPSAINIPNQVYEAYDSGTNTYSIVFYNDGLYENVDVTESDLDYDHVPLKCETLESVNGDILALGGITEGYDRPTVDASLSVSYYAPPVDILAPTTGLHIVSITQYQYGSGNAHRHIEIGYDGTAHTGDILDVKLQDARDVTIINDYTYTVPVSQDGNTSAVLASFSALIPGAAYNAGLGLIIINPPTHWQLLSATVTDFNASTGLIKSISALKSNSSYQMALAHFDGWGRYFPIATGTNFILNTQSYAQSQGKSPQINWMLNSAPPAEAVSAQWLITLNNTHQTDLFVDAVLDVARTDQAPGYFVFNINPLRRFNQVNSSSILSYEFTEGDRCTFAFYYSSGTTPVWFNNPPVDVEVGGFEITDIGDYILKVKKSAYVTQADIVNKNLMLELYTPRLRTISVGGTSAPAPQLFYEIGEQIGITNGAYDTTSGSITDGDVYFKIRQYSGASDPNTLYNFAVEDFNYSDFYPSAFNSYGRARFYLDEPGNIERKACIRYSDEAFRQTQINGLNRFFPDSIYGERDGETSANFGWIRRIEQRGSTLIAIHEIEIAYIPTNETLVEDQSGSGQYALSLKLFNNCRYSGLGFGIGNAKTSFVRYYNNLYFFDPNKSLPVRAGLDGIHDISGKMSQFFKRTGQLAYSQGKLLIGYYDIYNNEYLLATETDGDIVLQIPLNAGNWVFEDTYVIPANAITTGGLSHGTVSYNTSTGIATFTPTTGYSGSAGFTFTFTPSGGSPTTKNICITVTAGSDAVNSFAFQPRTGVEINTVYASPNTILVFGNTIAATISISGAGSPEYSINGGAYTSSAGSVVSGDIVQVRLTSSGSLNTLRAATLTIDGQSAVYNVTTKTVTSTGLALRVDTSSSTVCGAEFNTYYVAGTVSDITTGNTLYTNSNLTTLLTGYTFVVGVDGTIYALDPVTGVVGVDTGSDCGVTSTFRFDQIYNNIGEDAYLTEVSFIGTDVYTFTQPQLSNIPISPAIPAGTYNIEISSQGLIGSVKLNGAGVSCPGGLCQNGSGGSGGEIYDFIGVVIPASIDFAIILDPTACP